MWPGIPAAYQKLPESDCGCLTATPCYVLVGVGKRHLGQVPAQGSRHTKWPYLALVLCSFCVELSLISAKAGVCCVTYSLFSNGPIYWPWRSFLKCFFVKNQVTQSFKAHLAITWCWLQMPSSCFTGEFLLYLC